MNGYPCNRVKRAFNHRMAQPVPLREEVLEAVAHRFAVLAEPSRLRLLQVLLSGERSVNELVKATGGTQANVSRHLQTLIRANLLSRRKQGLQVFYAISDPSIFKLCDIVCSSIEKQLAKQSEVFHR